MRTSFFYLKFHMHYWLQLCHICWGDIGYEFMTSSWPRNLSTIYRPDRKWSPDFVSQVLYGVLTSNLSHMSNLSDMFRWQKHYIHDIIMVVMRLGYNLQRRWKMKARFGISSFTCTFDFQSCDDKKNRKLMMSINTKWFNVILDKDFPFLI